MLREERVEDRGGGAMGEEDGDECEGCDVEDGEDYEDGEVGMSSRGRGKVLEEGYGVGGVAVAGEVPGGEVGVRRFFVVST